MPKKKIDDEVVVESTARTVPMNLQRVKPKKQDDEIEALPHPAVSYPMDKIVEYAFNSTREKLREMTIIDRLQGRIFPIIDTCNYMMANLIEVAEYRESPDDYMTKYRQKKPKPTDASGEYLIFSAQWQKSVQGQNLMKAIDIALVEKESSAGDEEGYGGNPDVWGKE